MGWLRKYVSDLETAESVRFWWREIYRDDSKRKAVLEHIVFHKERFYIKRPDNKEETE